MPDYDFATPLLRLGMLCVLLALIVGGAVGYSCGRGGCDWGPRVYWKHGTAEGRR